MGVSVTELHLSRAGEAEAESLARAALLRAQEEEVRVRTEAARSAAAAEAGALKARAELERKRTELAMQKQEAKAAAEIAKAEAEAEEIRQRTEAARKAREAAESAEAEAGQRRAKAASSWRHAAIGFALVCALVSLPVQMSAFWNPNAWWLAAAPFVLEVGAWVALRGAAAAVEDRRPHWHYRLIAWGVAAIAAGINLVHGLAAFDPATAGATAFCSLAGPGMWDLHEHGRIRVREGKVTRAERKAREAAEEAEAAAKATAEQKREAEQKVKREAEKQAAEKLTKERAEKYPQEWERAVALAAALGETSVGEAVWRRAWRDLHAADPGETVEIVRTRNIAALRMNRALADAPAKGATQPASAQRGPQVPGPAKPRRRTPPPVRGVRRKGDTPKYVKAARTQASLAAKTATNSAAPGTA